MPNDTKEPKAAPTEVDHLGWWAALKRARPRMNELNISLLASGVAFWAVLSIFPAAIALVMVYGLVGNPDNVTKQVNNALSGLSKESKQAIGGQLKNIVSGQSGALSIGLVVSLALVLWSVSGGMQNFMKALTTAFEQKETRGYLKLRLTALALSIAAIVLAAVAIGAIGVVPALVSHLDSGPLRIVLLVVEVVVLLGLIIAVIAALYRFAPANKPVGWRWASAGASFAGVLLVVFTIAFAVYVQNFSKYNKTYGALAGVIILMLWLYYSVYVVLMGALVNAEGEREVKGNAEAEPEDVDRDVVRAPDEEGQERRLRDPSEARA